jgi:GH35 family endo-1,4-beta-xylanase
MRPTTMTHPLSRLAVLLCSAAWTSSAAADDALDAANARIVQHRQADAVIHVVDPAGRPVPNAVVRVEQLRHKFLFGCNLFGFNRAGSAEAERLYRERFAQLFNFATLGFYWASYEPHPGQTLETERREAIAWCRDHGIVPKGHPLAWNHADPRWLSKIEPNEPSDVLALQYARTTRDATALRGQIAVWDVVNEATAFDRETFLKSAPRLTAAWQSAGRVPFIVENLTRARAADPAARLLVNDYIVTDDYAAVLDEVLRLAPSDPTGRPPFDAIGIQSHQHWTPWPDAKVTEVCDRFARFGVPLHFTETTLISGARRRGQLDVAPQDREPWPSTPEGEAAQADAVERFYTLVFAHPATEALTWWDFSDRNAWRGAPAGLLRADMSPKPAYDRLLGLVKGRWWTRARATADSAGTARVRAFLGEHLVTVEHDGQTVTARLMVDRNAPDNLVTITLP